MKMIKPIPIPEKNIRIGIIQTADADVLFPRRYSHACDELQSTFSGEIRDYTIYGSPLSKRDTRKELADRLHQAVKENDMLLSLTGGYTTNCILPYLDYNLIRESRRVFVGYSDTTALLMAIFSKSGLASLYGPALLGSFGEWPHVNPDTAASLKALIYPKQMIYRYPYPEKFSESHYYWDREDRKELEYGANVSWRSNSDMVVEGRLAGGNLNTLLAVSGTEYCRFPEDTVLFLEDTFISMGQLKRDIETLRQRDRFQNVKGILAGKFFQCGSAETVGELNQYLLDTFTQLEIPVLVNVDFGHCYPILSMPIGLSVRVNYAAGEIDVLETFVTQ